MRSAVAPAAVPPRARRAEGLVIGTRLNPDLFALAHHKAVEEFDLGAPAFLHILAHRGTLRGGGALAVLETLRVKSTHRRFVALASRGSESVAAAVFFQFGKGALYKFGASDELLPLCEERGIGVIAGGVFNSGILAGGTTFDYEAAPPEVVARVEYLRDVCARHDVPLRAAAVQFPLRHPAVRTVLVGCRSPEEVEEDVHLSQLELPEPLWGELA